MNIRFQNLGSIRDTKFDLKPLTVIIGPNNSNKTYVAYSVYGLLQDLQNRARISDAKLTEEADQWQLPLTHEFCNQVRNAMHKVLHRFVTGMTAYFGDSSKKIFASTAIECELSDTEILDCIRTAPTQTFVINTSGDYRVGVANDCIFVRSHERTDLVTLPDAKPLTKATVLSMISHWLFRAIIPSPFLLPAERNAFIITYKTLIGNRNRALAYSRQRREGTASDEQLTLFENEASFRYPAPIEDFLQFLYDSEQRKSRFTPAQFAKIATVIETQLQNANRTHYRDAGIGSELAIEVTDDLTIDLYNASSSIKQLAPLIIYLRTRARKNDLLIIDEPEMNLHPESQAKLLEVLAIMVNKGINVLITTHSPYMMQHLNNLVLRQGTALSKRKRMAESLYLGDADAFLESTKVGAYEMKNHELISLDDDDYGIRWDTLSDVSVALHEKSFNLSED